MTGLVVDDTGFELVAGDRRVGPRRLLSAGDVSLLGSLAGRYAAAVRAGSGGEVFAALGRELFVWLEGDEGQLSCLLEEAGTPLVFEVQGLRHPSEAAWSVLRAPWELLAWPDAEFLAQDGLARFCVARRLGPPGERPPLDAFGLGLAFMASSPRSEPELDFEHEEAAILAAVGETRLDLLVDDSGDPGQLAVRLAEAGGMPVVHLSCHGHNSWRVRPGQPRVPVLMVEDDAGGPRATAAEDLVRLLVPRPRLLFVSACLTATGADAADRLPPADGRKAGLGGNAADGGLVAHSLATALVTAGVPAVLGWDGSVSDEAATVFAGRLYAALAARGDLSEAVGDARRALLDAEDEVLRADWHLARLWLGPAGGGPLVAGSRRRTLVPADRGTRAFLAGKPQVPVAPAEMFVGRRPQLQRALRALRSGERAGVLLYGQGRLGKSSLAARIADRCPDYAVAVVFGDYTALGILDAVAAAVQGTRAARELIEERLPQVRQRPEAVEGVLADLLSGPCAQAGDNGQRPLLLVIDDLEQILVPDPDGPHRVDAAYARVLAAVLRAFDPASTRSRLLVTSRYVFTLSGLESQLEAVQLPPMSPVARLKLQRRQQAITPPELQAERAGLAARAMAVSRGNPGLQDLVGLRLVYGQRVALDRAEAAIAGMEAYLDRGDPPAEPAVREFVENLALDVLLAEAGSSGTALLRAATLFDLPVPEPVIQALAAQIGGSPGRLRGLGLLAPYPDRHDPSRLALAADPLATGRMAPLSDDERAALAGIAAGPLLQTWGGPELPSGRAAELDLQLARLALAADNPDVAAVSGPRAVGALRSGPAAAAFRLGQDAIDLLDRHGRRVPLTLLREAADAALTSGDGLAGEALLDRAARQAQAGDDDEGLLGRARVMAEQGFYLITRGEPDRAEQLLRNASELMTAAGSEGEAAVAMGGIADIAYARGEVDEALRIRREVQLPVYERLGDARSAAVAWGQIADIAYRRGEVDEALRIRREVQLPVYERLGDARSVAVTWGKIADIAYDRGEVDEALRIRREVQLPVYEQLGDARETAITWGQIADIAYDRGEVDEALRIRREVQLPAFERLGDARSAAITWGQIADIAYDRGEVDEALRIRREVQLPAYERLGDARETAMAWGKIADIAYRRGEYDEALRIRREVELPVYERLGDARSVAVTWGKIADIAYDRGEVDEALRIRREVTLPVYERLGDARSVAVTWGKIADIAYRRGEVDEALRIRREVQLPVYERLGDARETAMAWGKIADIAYDRGEVDEALRIRREVQLPAYERLGDARLAAITWGQIADIAYDRGEVDEALRIRREVELPVYERIGDAHSVAVTWGQIADIAYDRGEVDEALRIRREVELPAFERLGDARSVAVTWGSIADIAYQRGDYDEALRIRREVELPAFERLGDARSVAVTWGSIADIAYQRGDYDEALRIRRDVQLPAFERLGDTRSVAVTWGSIADIALRHGDYDEAAELQAKRLEVNRQLGDLDGIAAASWNLASIDLARQDFQAAAPRLIEAFQIFRHLQRPDGIAAAGNMLGQLLLAAGHADQGRQVLQDAIAAASKIGWTDMARQISELLQSQPPDEET